MKIRTKLTLTLFLLTTILISIFSALIFYQVSERTLGRAQADLVQHLQHDFQHLREIKNAELQTRNYLKRLGSLLAFAILLVAGLMVPASWWIAGWCLAPFRRLADQTATMDASALSFRFPDENLRKSNDEYYRLVEAFNQLFTRLDHSFVELNLFAAKASHELKTPLASIIAQTEKALRQTEFDFETRTTLQKILAQAARLSRVTEQLLVLADVDAQKSRPQQIPADAATVIRGIVESLGPKATARKMSLHADLPQSITVKAGADILAISVGNLVENALKFGRKDVFLRLKQHAGAAEIWVEDDGPGLSEAQTIKITTPFERNRMLSDGSQNPGSGLGLAIVQTAVDSVKGSLSFTKSKYGGVLARITIPLTA